MSNPVCPNCGLQLIEKVNRKTGRFFYGCPDWPSCNDIVEQEEKGYSEDE